MSQRVRFRSSWSTRVLLCAAAALALGVRGLCEEGSTAPAPKAPSAASKERAEPRGRLPNFYRHVVDDQQREEIYAIQAEYKPRIDALKAQLEALVQERDAKVATVLTAEQRAEVERLRAEAEAKRAKKKSRSSPAARTPRALPDAEASRSSP